MFEAAVYWEDQSKNHIKANCTTLRYIYNIYYKKYGFTQQDNAGHKIGDFKVEFLSKFESTYKQKGFNPYVRGPDRVV
jgi:hypothetical protein